MQTLPNPTKTLTTEPIFDTTIKRRKTRPVKVGSVTIGGGYPVVVQSMINEDTLDIDGSVAGIRRLHEIGCEIVRVTVPSMAHAKALAEIKQKLHETYQASTPGCRCPPQRHENCPGSRQTRRQSENQSRTLRVREAESRQKRIHRQRNSRKLAQKSAKPWNL